MKIMNLGAWNSAAWYRGTEWNKPSDAELIASLALFHIETSADFYPSFLEIAESLAFDGAVVA